MKKKPLNEYDMIELNKALNSRKTYYIIFISMFFVTFLISMYNFWQTKEFKTSNVIPVILFPILFQTWKSYQEAKKEFENRK